MRASEEHSPPPSSSGTPGNYLEISQRDGDAVWLHQLANQHVVIGRSEDAAICLDHSTVSRRHAELVRGPYGHWWVHDLGSTNGTFVNGNRADERLLRPGDVVGVGCFSLVLRAPPRASRRGLEDVPSFTDEATVVMSKLDIVTPISGSPRALSPGQLAKVLALGRTLLMFDDPNKRLTHACEFMVGEDFPAERAAVVRLEGGSPTEVVAGPARRHERDTRPLHYSRGVLRTVWDTRTAVVGHSGTEDRTAPLGALRRHTGVPIKRLSSGGFAAPVAVMALPIGSGANELDCLYLELSPTNATSEWLALASFIAASCEQAELASEMRYHGRIAAFVERELEMARQIQEGFIPRALRFDGLDTAVRFHACRWVGGDFLDVVPLGDGRVLLAIADVCGKGLQAALVASSLHTLVRASADGGEGLAELMTRFNHYFCSYLPDHSFVTMLALSLDAPTGRFVYANAGHPPALVISTGQRMRRLHSSSTALGMLRGPVLIEEGTLDSDEVLVLYTDGITEACDEEGEPFGIARLGDAVCRTLAHNPDASADELCDAIGHAFEEHRGAHLDIDDRAWLVARRVT
jgi:serine phosphatase RsbU (regulator of sigma subunit)